VSSKSGMTTIENEGSATKGNPKLCAAKRRAFLFAEQELDSRSKPSSSFSQSSSSSLSFS